MRRSWWPSWAAPPGTFLWTRPWTMSTAIPAATTCPPGTCSLPGAASGCCPRPLTALPPSAPAWSRELDPTALDISSQVNGQTRQSSNTGDMIFSVAQIIADLSRHFTLMPGDLIFTGTPQGVMQGYPADRKDWLKPGDRVSVTIQGIGTLENTFV